MNLPKYHTRFKGKVTTCWVQQVRSFNLGWAKTIDTKVEKALWKQICSPQIQWELYKMNIFSIRIVCRHVHIYMIIDSKSHTWMTGRNTVTLIIFNTQQKKHRAWIGPLGEETFYCKSSSFSRSMLIFGGVLLKPKLWESMLAIKPSQDCYSSSVLVRNLWSSSPSTGFFISTQPKPWRVHLINHGLKGGVAHLGQNSLPLSRPGIFIPAVSWWFLILALSSCLPLLLDLQNNLGQFNEIWICQGWSPTAMEL